MMNSLNFHFADQPNHIDLLYTPMLGFMGSVQIHRNRFRQFDVSPPMLASSLGELDSFHQ